MATAAKKTKPKPSQENALLEILAMVEKAPVKELSKLPEDGSKNHDHYLYGSPKKP